MFFVHSAAANGSPPPPPAPLIPNLWDALPWFSDGAVGGAAAGSRGGAGCDGGSNRNNSSRLPGCFISLPLPSSSSSVVPEDRNTRRRRSRNRRSNVENRDTIRSVGSRLLQASSTTSTSGNTAGTAAASPEVLPEWLGRLGLDKEEEEGLVAAFAALPDPPPPAAADAKLVQAAKDSRTSTKKPEAARGRVAIEASGRLKGVTIDVTGKKKRVRAVPEAKKKVPLKATEIEPLEILEEGNGGGDGGGDDGGESVELKVKAAREAGELLEVKNEPLAVRKRTVREPLTEEEVKTRDGWLKKRLRLDGAALARMKEIFPHVGDRKKTAVSGFVSPCSSRRVSSLLRLYDS